MQKKRLGVALTARDVSLVRHRTTRNRLNHVGKDRYGDEESGYVVENQRHGASVRVLEGPPHGLAVSHVGEFAVFVVLKVVHKTLHVLPLAVLVLFVTAVTDDFGNDSKERQLLVVSRDALVAWVVQLPCAVEVKNTSEQIRISVKEILPSLLIEEEFFFGAPQERIRVTV